MKCKSCGATTPGSDSQATWTYDFSLCFECGRLMDKGNFCPICRKCYSDDDWESKMIQCNKCESWVHSKCEGLTGKLVSYFLADHQMALVSFSSIFGSVFWISSKCYFVTLWLTIRLQYCSKVFSSVDGTAFWVSFRCKGKDILTGIKELFWTGDCWIDVFCHVCTTLSHHWWCLIY